MSANTSATTAGRRAIKLFVIFAGDLSDQELLAIHAASRPAREDGATFALVVPEGKEPTAQEQLVADLFVGSQPAPSPFGLFLALEASEIPDVRLLALIGTSVEALEAGHRAGARAIIGLREPDDLVRATMELARPTHIISSRVFDEVDQSQFASTRPIP